MNKFNQEDAPLISHIAFCRMSSFVGVGTVSLFSVLSCQSANAVTVPTTIWGNEFGSSVQEFSLSDGSLLKSYDPNSVFGTNGYWNGRGVVQVGNTLYLTNAYSNNVYEMDATTGAKIGTGVAFSITGSSGLSAIAYDGTNFWVGDYSGTNKAYLYTPTGTLLKTITISQSSGYSDGLEYFNGNLIVNRVDGCCGGTPVIYDTYDTNGNLLSNTFISNPYQSTGIAFDGTNFWTSNIYNYSLSEWDGTTGAYITTLALSGIPSGLGIEDLSVNYSQVLPPPISGVPEPSTYAMLLAGLGLIGFIGYRRKSNCSHPNMMMLA
jgi:PEP-CTERM motif